MVVDETVGDGTLAGKLEATLGLLDATPVFGGFGGGFRFGFLLICASPVGACDGGDDEVGTTGEGVLLGEDAGAVVSTIGASALLVTDGADVGCIVAAAEGVLLRDDGTGGGARRFRFGAAACATVSMFYFHRTTYY